MKTFMIHIRYSNGSFEDRYVKAASAEAAIAKVKLTVKDRWARFVA